MAEPFYKNRTGTIRCTIRGVLGSIIGGGRLSILFVLPLSYGTFVSIYIYLFIGMILGGVISLIGLGVAGSNPQAGGTIAIVGSILGGINVLTLIGGIFLLQGLVIIKTEIVSASTSSGKKGGVPGLDLRSGAERALKTRRETREKEA